MVSPHRSLGQTLFEARGEILPLRVQGGDLSLRLLQLLRQFGDRVEILSLSCFSDLFADPVLVVLQLRDLLLHLLLTRQRFLPLLSQPTRFALLFACLLA